MLGKMFKLAHDLHFEHLAVMNMHPEKSSKAKKVKPLMKTQATTQKNLLLVQQEMQVSEGIVFCWGKQVPDPAFIRAVSSLALTHGLHPRRLHPDKPAMYISGEAFGPFGSYEGMPTFDCEAGMGVRLGAPR